MRQLHQLLHSRLRQSPVGSIARGVKDQARFLRDRKLHKNHNHKLLMVFSGAGGQWPKMGQQLYLNEPVFRESIDQCSRVVEAQMGFSIARDFAAGIGHTKEEYLARRSPGDSSSRASWHKHGYIKLAALHIAECDLWRAHGVVPDGVLGSSLSEATASYMAGALSLEDAMRVACTTVNAICEQDFDCKWVFVEADYQKSRWLCRHSPARLDVIGTLSPLTTLLLADSADFPQIQEFLQRENVAHSAMKFDRNSHTSRLPHDRAKIERELKNIQPRPATIAHYSSLAGSLLPPDTILDSLFWYGVINRQCRLGDALQAALRDGYDTILNIGARPTLSRWLSQTQQFLGCEICVLDSMRHDEPERATWKQSARVLKARGFVSKNSSHSQARNGARSTPARADDAAIKVAAIKEAAIKNAAIKVTEQMEIKAAISAVSTLDARFLRDPYSAYEVLRRAGTVHFLPSQNCWLVLGREEISEIFKQPDIFSNAPVSAFDPVLAGADPPEHTRARRMIARYFTSEKLQASAEYSGAQAQMLLQAAREKSRIHSQFDALADFSIPLTEKVIGHFLGLTEEKVASVRRKLEPFRDDSEMIFQILRQDFNEHIFAIKQDLPLGNSSTQSGPQDFCSRMLAGLDGELFSSEELAGAMTILWVAGTETTRTVIADAILMLINHPEIKAQLQANDALLAPFVDEAMRLSSPVHCAMRLSKIETVIGGQTIPAGALIKLCLGAANRDAAYFPDPHRVSLERSTKHQLIFGMGIHRCIGATLARLEVQSAIKSLLQEMPDIRLAQPPASIYWSPSFDIRSLEELTVCAD